ncbi:unnamed protein product [Ostreobium quekettii]|uniref:Uncharacterized protein n=1 Tax=Ostreobium quekettii TaxID=121088 RepID=A0A8S1IUF5_9CHLO|nr:unnamed protein product [Ostreobium quekettii]|eukprot:evm.model.scf_38EXC.6 EVM.evm.TU.scf_38EXC.6   scf_38EXC:77673-80704(+)
MANDFSSLWGGRESMAECGGAHGCAHYRRRCRIVAPCCGEVFWCRHCHDAAKSDGERDPKKMHRLDRKAVKEVICELCGERQPVAASCRGCGVAFGRYSCMECNFFDDDTSKEQYHCEQCGICRVGGRENYFHCEICNCCYHNDMRGSHVCIQNSMHRNCPVCYEYLFDSIRNISVLRCGHTIHKDCLEQLLDYNQNYCPICKKTLSDNMSWMWRQMDDAVQSMPMPQEYANKMVRIVCNDCHERSEVCYHFIGHKCKGCGGYNTARC